MFKKAYLQLNKPETSVISNSSTDYFVIHRKEKSSCDIVFVYLY